MIKNRVVFSKKCDNDISAIFWKLHNNDKTIYRQTVSSGLVLTDYWQHQLPSWTNSCRNISKRERQYYLLFCSFNISREWKRRLNSASSSGAGVFKIVEILSDTFWTWATALVADANASPTSFLKKLTKKQKITFLWTWSPMSARWTWRSAPPSSDSVFLYAVLEGAGQLDIHKMAWWWGQLKKPN